MLMNNAGIGATTLGTSWAGLDAWHKIFDVNLFGCVFSVFRLRAILTDRRSYCRSVVNVQHAFVPVRCFLRAFALCAADAHHYPTPHRLCSTRKTRKLSFFAQCIRAPRTLAHMPTGRSMIINTGSKQGITNPPGNAAYNAAKAAVKSLTEGLSHELRQQAHSKVTAHLFV